MKHLLRLCMGGAVGLLVLIGMSITLSSNSLPLTMFNNAQYIVEAHPRGWPPVHIAPASLMYHSPLPCLPYRVTTPPSTPSAAVPPFRRERRPDWLEPYTIFLGWSNTRAYLADRDTENIRIWEVENQDLIAEFTGQVRDIWWSKSDEHLAAVLLVPRPSVYLLNLRTRQTRIIPIEDSPMRYAIDGVWSPDESGFVLLYRDENLSEYLTRYTLTEQPSTMLSSYFHRIRQFDGTETGVWAGTHLRYWEQIGGLYHLIDHDIATNEKLIAATSPRPPLQRGHIAAVYDDHPNGTHSIRLINLQDLTITPFIENAHDLGDPNFSPDRMWVAAVYDADLSLGRDIRVAWMRPDGNGYQEYRNTIYADIRHLEWSDEGDRLAFVGVHPGDAYDVHIADLQAGTVAPIISAAPDLLSWRGGGGELGWHYSYSDAAGQWHWLGLDHEHQPLYHAQTDVYIHHAELFPSPDGQHVAFKLHGAYPERYLALAQVGEEGVEGVVEAVTLRDDLAQWGALMWSPDSRMFVFGREMTRSNTEALIYNVEGNQIARFPNPYGNWMQCP